MVTVYTDVYNMRIELEKMKKPIGTRESPARSCKDLLFGHPQLKDGFYWIDPNLGMNDDAVKVYCSMSTGTLREENILKCMYMYLMYFLNDFFIKNRR